MDMSSYFNYTTLALSGKSDDECAFDEMRSVVKGRWEQRVKIWWETIQKESVGVSSEQTISAIRFLIETMLWTGDMRGDREFAQHVAEKIATGEPIEVIDILCLRWRLDQSHKSFVLIEDMEDHQFENVRFENEKENIRHILHIARIAARNAIPLKLTIAVSDLDLKITEHHPPDSPLFAQAQRFISSVRKFCADELREASTMETVAVRVVGLLDLLEEAHVSGPFHKNHQRLIRHFEQVARGRAQPLVPALHAKTLTRFVDDAKVVLLERPDHVHLHNDKVNENRALFLQVLRSVIRDFVLVRILSRCFSMFVVSTPNSQIPSQLNLAHVFTTSVQDQVFLDFEEVHSMTIVAIKHLRTRRESKIIQEDDVLPGDTVS